MNNNEPKDAAHICGFCQRSADKVGHLIVGPFSNVCDSCLALLNEAMRKNNQPSNELPDPLPSPRSIKEFMDDFVIGQERAKITLAVAVYNHYKRIKYREYLQKQDVEIEKSNVIIIGPSGTGKTLLARTLAKKLQVPFTIADATTLTEAGYVGEDVESILLKLYRAAGDNIANAEHGIIYIDEIDKIARRGENVSVTRDVSGEGVQQALLKIIEGTEATFSPTGGRKHPNQELLRINTANILFICGGAFVGLEEIINQRLTKNSMGFVSAGKDVPKDRMLAHIKTDDLINFGIIPEFVGRMPALVTLDVLSKDDIVTIATKPKNAIIRQYRVLLETDGIDLVVDDDAVEAIAERALLQKTGARGLRAIIEENLTSVLYNTIQTHNTPVQIVITKECVVEGKQPDIVKIKNSA